MDGLPNAMVKITALRPSQGGLGIELLDYIQPIDGRAIPSDLKSNDIAYVQVELVVSDMNQAMKHLQQSSMQVISPDTVQLGDRSSAQSYLIKDPTGHALLLLSESTP